MELREKIIQVLPLINTQRHKEIAADRIEALLPQWIPVEDVIKEVREIKAADDKIYEDGFQDAINFFEKRLLPQPPKEGE